MADQDYTGLINQNFQQFLGRAPEEAGLNYWTNQINTGAMTPDQVTNAIKNSQEGLAFAAKPPVQAAPLSQPEIAQTAPLSQPAVAQPVTQPDQTQTAITGAFNQYLGRAPEQAGLDYWSNQVNSGAMTVDQALKAIQASPEATARTAVTEDFSKYLGRAPEQEGLDYWTKQITSGAMTPEQAANAIKTSQEGAIYNAPQTVQEAFTKYLGRNPEQEGLDYWTGKIKSGEMTPEQVTQEIYKSQEATPTRTLYETYQKYLGRDPEAEGLKYWQDKIDSGEMSWSDVTKQIAGSEEGKKYLDTLNQDIAAKIPSYYTQQYDSNELGYYPRTNPDGSPAYGFTNPSAEQVVDYANKVYQNLLGRNLTPEETASLAQASAYFGQTGDQMGSLSNALQIEQAVLNSKEFQDRAARTGFWATDTRTGQPVFMSGEIAKLPGAAEMATTGNVRLTSQAYLPSEAYPEAIVGGYDSDGNPTTRYDSNKLAQAIAADPKRYMINLFNAASGGLQREIMVSQAGFANSGVTDQTLQKLKNDIQTSAKWLADNGVSQDQIQTLYDSARASSQNATAQSIADQKSGGGGGFWGGDWLGDFLEKYEVPIMASILGGAVLGPAIGGAVGAAPGSAAAIATNAATTGLTQTAVSLASGAPTNKALLAGGLAAAGAGLGGALGPSGANVAGTLVEQGVNPIVANVAVGALSGGALGALSGAASGNIGAGALGGALSGGTSAGVNAATNVFGGMTGTLARLAAGTAVGMLTGKDISSALQGAAVGTVVGLAGSATKNAINAAKSGSTDISVEGKITPNAETVDAMRKAAADELDAMLGGSDRASVDKYVASLPESYFTKALDAVDTEVANSIKLAASYPTEAVKEIFKQDLGREPETEGLEYYANKLRNGTSLADIQSEIQNSSEGQKYAALDKGTITDASGDSAIPKDITDYPTTAPVDVTVTPSNKDETTDGQFGDATPEFYKSAIDRLQNYISTGYDAATGSKLLPENIDAAKQMLSEFEAKYTGQTIQNATPEQIQQPSFWQDVLDKGASLFTFGTAAPDGGVAITGGGASGNLAGSKFSLFAFDGDQQKQQMVVTLEQAVNNPDLTPEQKVAAEQVLEKAKETPVTPKSGQAGSTTAETKQPGGDTGGGGKTTSPAPSGAPGEASEFNAAFNQIKSNTVTANQVKQMLNPMSPAALATSAIVPGSLSISKIQDDINVMYNTFLGRKPEKAGLDYWSNLVKSGQMTLADVANAIANSQEGKSKASTGTTTTGTGTGTSGTGTSTGTTGTGSGTGGGTGGGTGTGTGTGTGAGEGTGIGTGTGSSTGSGTGGSGTGTGSGTGSGSGGGTGTGTGSGSITNIAQYLAPTSSIGYGTPKDIKADIIGGGLKIDLGGKFDNPMIYSLPTAQSYIPAGGLMYATGGSVDSSGLSTSSDIGADTSDSDATGSDVVSGGTSTIDLGGKFGKTLTYSTTNPASTTQSYADGGEVGPHVMEGSWPGFNLAQRGGNKFKYLHSALPQVRSTEYAEGGHVPEFYSEGGLNNRYVNGNGDGTSDDVPAMLANGEFVIPADVVSALGNGSNDSGAQVLDELLQVIRAHKQNHDPKELPPDSLGPLAYLNKATKKAGK